MLDSKQAWYSSGISIAFETISVEVGFKCLLKFGGGAGLRFL